MVADTNQTARETPAEPNGGLVAQMARERLMVAMDRAEAVVREETGILRDGNAVNFTDFGLRKSQQLLELSRAWSAAALVRGTPDLAEAGQRLRTALEENASLLKARIGAVQEVADIVADALRAAESDGTYQRPKTPRRAT